MNTIQYIVVNKDLGMSIGKVAAQVAHAVNMAATEDDINAYFDANQRTVIVLQATSEQIRNLRDYLALRDISSDYVIDEATRSNLNTFNGRGRVNEIPTMSMTALATEQIDITDEEVRNYFAGFDLYGESEAEQAAKASAFIGEHLTQDRHARNVMKRLKNLDDEAFVW